MIPEDYRKAGDIVYKVVPVDKAIYDIIREHYLQGNTHCKNLQNDYYKHIESYDKNSKLDYVLKSCKYPMVDRL